MHIRFITSAILAVMSVSSIVFGECEPNWKPGNCLTSMDNYVLTFTKWDPDGNGHQPQMLIAGGMFTNTGNTAASRIASWDGGDWKPFGSGMSGVNPDVFALEVYNGELIAGGKFTKAGGIDANRIAMWDGNSWKPLGSGMNGQINSLTTYNGELIAGGYFTKAGDSDINCIARWDGNSWKPLGSGTNYVVYSLAVKDGNLIAGDSLLKPEMQM